MRRREIAHYLEHPPNCLHLNESFRPALFSKCDKRRKTRRRRVVVFLSFVLREEQGRLLLDDCDLVFFFTRFFSQAFSRLLLQVWLRQQFAAAASAQSLKKAEIYTSARMTSGKKAHNQPPKHPRANTLYIETIKQ